MSGAIGLVLIVNAESARELDDLVTSLPVWSRMETDVTPLTTFEGRAETLRPRLERWKAQTRGGGAEVGAVRAPQKRMAAQATQGAAPGGD
jgi:Muconolactone delta-isomerase